MIDEKGIKKAQETLDNEMAKELGEALRPEPKEEGSRSFHAGKARGLKQVLDELLGPNKDQWARWKPSNVGIPKVEETLAAVLETLSSGAAKAANEVGKPEASSSYRDFQAGLCSGLRRGIGLLDPNKK